MTDYLNGAFAPKCQHVDTTRMRLDERRPVLEHVTCSECLMSWKEYGVTWMIPTTKREVVKWWNRVLIAKGRYHEIVEID